MKKETKTANKVNQNDHVEIAGLHKGIQSHHESNKKQKKLGGR